MEMNVKENLVLMLMFVLVSMILSGCRSQAQLPEGPVYFVDANSGKSVAPVLLISYCSTFSGVTTKMGHGPQKGKNGILFANPFIYYSDGSPFKVKPPSSTVIIVPFLWMGIVPKGVLFNGVDVYAKGYKVGDVPFRLLNKPRPQTFKLKPLDETESKKEFARISEGLRNRKFEILSTYPSIREDEILEFDFSRKELKMMETFFETGAKTK
jgi:hypothetical protein